VVLVAARKELRWKRRLQQLGLVMACFCAAATLLWLAGMHSDETSSAAVRAFAEESDATLNVRQQIWTYAATAFFERPLLGQGFGGWQQGFEIYARNAGLQEGFPPHNTLIYLWSQGGALAAALGLLFMYSVLSFAKRQLHSNGISPSVGIGLATSISFAWVFIHGLGENFGLLGDEHMTPVLAALLALAYAKAGSLSLGAGRSRSGK